MKKKFNKAVATVHLFVDPQSNNCNIYTRGHIFDLEALLVTAARLNEDFERALLEAATFISKERLTDI